MTKGEFMRELEKLLSRLPQGEKRDALEYYNDYFAEAGITDDMLIPASMGTPAEIAESIIKDAFYGEEDASASDTATNNSEYYYGGQSDNDWNVNENKSQSNENVYSDDKKNDNTRLVIAIVLLVVFSPAIIGLVLGVVGTLIGVFGALVGTTVALIVSGIALIVTAFLSSGVAGVILLAGAGLLITAIGMGSAVLLSMYCGQFIPWLVRECSKLIKWLFGKKEQIL